MKKALLGVFFLVLIGGLAAHSGEKHVRENASTHGEGSDVWKNLSSAYPSQTLAVVMIEVGLVGALVFLAARHRLQLRSR